MFIAASHFILSVTASANFDSAPRGGKAETAPVTNKGIAEGAGEKARTPRKRHGEHQHLTTDIGHGNDEAHVPPQFLRRESGFPEQPDSDKSTPRTMPQPPSSLAAKEEQSSTTVDADCYNAKDIASISSSFVADATFWGSRCEVIPPDTFAIRVKMGTVVDYFRPAGSSSWCDMMVSSANHDWWDPTAKTWITPYVESPPSNDTLGGSADYTSYSTDSNKPSGGRQFLSFWGSNSHGGGCCEDNIASPTCGGSCDPTLSTSYGKTVLVSICARCHTVKDVLGNTATTDTDFFASNVCPNIPSTATAIRITMNAITDYFRPAASTTTLCSMLKAQNLHEWSPDASNWTTPDYYTTEATSSNKYLGGSAEDWPKNNVLGDNRKFLSFWGTGKANTGTTHSGGCCDNSFKGNGCQTSTGTFPYSCYSKAYKMEYCRI